MQPRQKKFLVVAVPFFVVAVLTSLVSMMASVVVTMSGLLVFGYFFSRQARSLALQPCVHCARKIIFEHEGEFCPACNAPTHAKCMDDHRMSHAPSPDQPFR